VTPKRLPKHCEIMHILCWVKRPGTGEKGFGKFGGGVQARGLQAATVAA